MSKDSALGNAQKCMQVNNFLCFSEKSSRFKLAVQLRHNHSFDTFYALTTIRS